MKSHLNPNAWSDKDWVTVTVNLQLQLFEGHLVHTTITKTVENAKEQIGQLLEKAIMGPEPLNDEEREFLEKMPRIVVALGRIADSIESAFKDVMNQRAENN